MRTHLTARVRASSSSSRACRADTKMAATLINQWSTDRRLKLVRGVWWGKHGDLGGIGD
jgi:hypothetical protein